MFEGNGHMSLRSVIFKVPKAKLEATQNRQALLVANPGTDF
jgi:hypothetical protein